MSIRQDQNVNDLRQHLIDVWSGVEWSVINDDIDQWNVSMPSYKTSIWLFIMTYIRQNVVNCNKIKFITVNNVYNNFINKILCFRLLLVSGHLLSQGSVVTRFRCGGIFSAREIVLFFDSRVVILATVLSSTVRIGEVRPEGPRAGMGFLGRRSASTSPILGKRCKLLQRGSGGVPAAKGFSCILCRQIAFPSISVRVAYGLYG